MGRPNPENLVAPWKPGQSGNPNGFSKKSRLRATLKAATLEGLASKLPPSILDRLPEELRGLDLEDTAQLIATRLLLSALDPNDRHWRDSVSLIASLERGEKIEVEETKPDLVEIPDSTEHEEAVRAALKEALEA
jgi:hypothetical protein